MNQEVVVDVSHLSKKYNLYARPSDRLLEALGLSKKQRHTEHFALNDVSFCVRRGETVGIIGTNGSGKSTALKIITGVLNPTSGNVSVKGRISALLELGAGFHMEYDGIENIYLNGAMLGFTEKEIDDRLQEILDFADIGEYVHQPVKTYSSGMFVRLAFALAINIDPEILIVDEALSVGDVFFQAKCYHKFEEFKEQGKTILFVSHDLGSIAKYCDRVLLLNQGTLLCEGEPKEMIDAYKRVLVGQYPLSETAAQDILPAAEHTAEKEKIAGDSELLEYGDQKAQISAYYVTDEYGARTETLLKGSMFTVHMRVAFAQALPAPIFAFTIKDVKGTEITGTNTMAERAFLEPVAAGEVKEITFTQKMNLQGGEYLLSFGVTGFRGDTFEVYHRLYDALHISVISEKNTVGYYDMESEVRVTDAEKARL